ncbi:hypothetical protein LC607_36195 [Nostoc sp. CHAB 5824]|nr:hypothetical protein [Nostoc sp. CHAB 5824]
MDNRLFIISQSILTFAKYKASVKSWRTVGGFNVQFITIKRCKFMKNVRISLLMFSCLIFFILGCSGERKELKPSEVQQSKKITILETSNVSENDEVFVNFKNSESFQILKSNIPNLEFNKIQKIAFSDTSVRFLIIALPESGPYKRELVVAYKSSTPDLITSFIRESSVTGSEIDGKLSFNGDINFYNADYSRLNEVTLTNNKITKFKKFTSDLRFSLSNARPASSQACTWQCVGNDFNCEYQLAKATCESDWQCDIAGNWSLYLVAAIIACTVCV